jgi:hypothetical protein
VNAEGSDTASCKVLVVGKNHNCSRADY